MYKPWQQYIQSLIAYISSIILILIRQNNSIIRYSIPKWTNIVVCCILRYINNKHLTYVGDIINMWNVPYYCVIIHHSLPTNHSNLRCILFFPVPVCICFIHYKWYVDVFICIFIAKWALSYRILYIHFL